MSNSQNNSYVADILVVDDSYENLLLLRNLLTKQGYKVRPASSGQDALDAVEQFKPDLILLDVKMPGIDGFGVCKMLKKKYETESIPIIFVTSLVNPKDVAKGLGLGAVDYISKPIMKEEVVAKVSNHLELKMLRDNLEEIVSKRTKALFESEHRYIKSQKELRALVENMQAVREEEQRRIARDIHDELGQILTAINIDVSWIEEMLEEDRNEISDKAQEVSELVTKAIGKVQKISSELRPTLLDDLGITAAIEWQINKFQNRTGIRCHFVCRPAELHLTNKPSTEIYRIFQETMTNVARHAEATEVEITLTKSDESVVLEVKDNGRGITDEEISNSRSIGLVGIRERAYSLHGDLKINGEPGKGSCVMVTFPTGSDT